MQTPVSPSQTPVISKDELFHLMIEEVTDYAIFVLDPQGYILTWNKGAERFKGYKAEEIIGKHFSIFYPDYDIQNGKPEMELEVASEQGRFEDEGWRIRKNGTQFWANVIITCLRNKDGQIVGFAKITRDLTERKKSEDNLRNSEARLKEAQSIAHIGNWEWDASTGKIIWSEELYHIFGYGELRPEIMFDIYLNHIHPDDRPRSEEMISRALKLQGNFSYKERVITKRGEVRYIQNIFKVIVDHNKESSGIIGTIQDITDLRKAEIAIQEKVSDLARSQDFLDSLIEHLPLMIFVKDAKELRFVRFNKAGEELLGYSRNELLGKNDYDFFPKDQADFFTAKDRAVLGQKKVVDIPEEEISTREKGARLLHTKKIPLFNAEGEAEYLLGISVDITDQKRALEERLRINREQAAIEERERASKRDAFLSEATAILSSSLNYKETLKHIAELSVPQLSDWCTVTIKNEEDKFERVAAVHRDPEKAKLLLTLADFGPEKTDNGTKEIIETGKTFLSRMVPEEQLKTVTMNEDHRRLLRELGIHSYMLIPIPGRDRIHGAIAFMSGSSGRIYGSEDVATAEELGRRAGIAIDNALLYDASKKAIQVRDEFLSIASHELKTPLTSLKLQMQMTRRGIKPDGTVPPAQNLIRVIDSSTHQVDRLTELVEDLLDVSRIQSGKLEYNFEECDVSGIVNEVVERFKEQFEEAHMASTVKIEEGLKAVWDRSRFEQVVVNLLSNALKYAPEKPIAISLVRTGENITFSVADQGPGISRTRQAKIFERFERASASRNISGLGLGLFIVKKIVEAHKGVINVESEEKKGAIFSVTLPLNPISPREEDKSH